MDAVKYLKIKAKICRSIKDDNCKGCVLKGNAVLGCHTTERLNPEECVAQVEKWAAEHPVKTRQDEFLRMYPNAWIDANGGYIKICPRLLDKNYDCIKTPNCALLCLKCLKEYWLAEVE